MAQGRSYAGYERGTNNAGVGIAEVTENGVELVIGRQARKFKGGEQVVNNKDTLNLLKSKGDNNINVNLIIKCNVIGNEEYMDEVGEYIAEKILTALNNM